MVFYSDTDFQALLAESSDSNTTLSRLAKAKFSPDAMFVPGRSYVIASKFLIMLLKQQRSFVKPSAQDKSLGHRLCLDSPVGSLL